MLTGLRNVLGISYTELVVVDAALAAELDTAVAAHGEELLDEELTTPLRWVPIVLQILDELERGGQGKP